jgi:16S rRNA (adenine1518-N6/adenine1519-N6)-dimethyltransferase
MPSSNRPHPRAKKRLGQHFLTDPRILARIADALELGGDEIVVEIGPGRGALTEELLRRAGRVVAVELDRELARRLRETYAANPRLTVVEADVLDLPLGQLGGDDYLLAGNVPYYITTPILFHALERPRPRRAVYLVQREVAERIVASAGSDDYGALSANVQAVANAEMLFRIPAGAFLPPPKVESTVIRVTPRPDPVITPDEEAPFRRLVQSCFAFRRKQMRRVLRTVSRLDAERAEAVLGEAGIDLEVRPEVLGPEQFARLLRALRALPSGSDPRASGHHPSPDS